jgi:NhaP-type Na+/H+ or K+/H+ antiporter
MTINLTLLPWLGILCVIVLYLLLKAYEVPQKKRDKIVAWAAAAVVVSVIITNSIQYITF